MPSIRPQDLVFTLFGEYLLHRSDPVPVQSLIRLLSPFGLSEGAVRTVLSRMASKRWLSTSRRGQYGLTSRGRRLLEAGEAKILHARWEAEWDGQWFVLAYSIPEEARQVRDRLRDRLAWLGFGSLGNGLWISPHDVTREVDELAAERKLAGRLVCFRGVGVGATEPARLVSTCWDLAGIQRRYEKFIGRWAKRFTKYRDSVPFRGAALEQSYVLRFRLIHEYREFPLLDPYLPRELLPEDWAGECAAHLFRVFHDMLVEPADGWVDSVLSSSSRSGDRPARRKARPAHARD
jgi:phenylacetic acid degradation operon negative regulatory protein